MWARGALGVGARGAWPGRGLGAGRAAWALGERPGRWARGLGAWAGQGCALGALGLFLARFDSVFS